MSETLLSIIIPVYNTEPYLQECLESIIEQSLSNYEVIIINDGSTDSRQLIIDEYIETYNNFKSIFQTNSGQSVARNRGIESAKGKYLYFFDSDDKLSDNFSKIIDKYVANENLDAIFFDGEVFLSKDFLDTNELNNYTYKRQKSRGFFNFGYELFDKLIEEKEFYVSPCLYIVRKDVVVNNNLFFLEGLIHEDELFTSQLMFYLERVVHTNDVGFLRRLRPNSTMTTADKSKSFKAYVKVLEELSLFYSAFNFPKSSNKKYMLDRMEQLYLKCLELKERVSIDQSKHYENRVRLLGKQNKYFGFIGWVASLNYSIGFFLFRVKNKLQTMRR